MYRWSGAAACVLLLLAPLAPAGPGDPLKDVDVAVYGPGDAHYAINAGDEVDKAAEPLGGTPMDDIAIDYPWRPSGDIRIDASGDAPSAFGIVCAQDGGATGSCIAVGGTHRHDTTHHGVCIQAEAAGEESDTAWETCTGGSLNAAIDPAGDVGVPSADCGGHAGPWYQADSAGDADGVVLGAGSCIGADAGAVGARSHHDVAMNTIRNHK